MQTTHTFPQIASNANYGKGGKGGGMKMPSGGGKGGGSMKTPKCGGAKKM